MDLATALLEFSELLDVAARSLESILQNGDHSAIAPQVVEEITEIAARLQEISEKVCER